MAASLAKSIGKEAATEAGLGAGATAGLVAAHGGTAADITGALKSRRLAESVAIGFAGDLALRGGATGAAGAAKGSRAAIATVKASTASAGKTAVAASKAGAKAAKAGAKAAAGPVGWALLGLDVVSMGLDQWDPLDYGDTVNNAQLLGTWNAHKAVASRAVNDETVVIDGVPTKLIHLPATHGGPIRFPTTIDPAWPGLDLESETFADPVVEQRLLGYQLKFLRDRGFNLSGSDTSSRQQVASGPLVVAQSVAVAQQETTRKKRNARTVKQKRDAWIAFLGTTALAVPLLFFLL